ncbi:MAG TPA: hypothetical protein DIS88_03305 [Prevotella sp.]|nr:hypothetical protein [Prevotella sp.]
MEDNRQKRKQKREWACVLSAILIYIAGTRYLPPLAREIIIIIIAIAMLGWIIYDIIHNKHVDLFTSILLVLIMICLTFYECK